MRVCMAVLQYIKNCIKTPRPSFCAVITHTQTLVGVYVAIAHKSTHKHTFLTDSTRIHSTGKYSTHTNPRAGAPLCKLFSTTAARVCVCVCALARSLSILCTHRQRTGGLVNCCWCCCCTSRNNTRSLADDWVKSRKADAAAARGNSPSDSGDDTGVFLP